MNYQEQILDLMLSSISNGAKFSDYETVKTIRDCFAITRIENEIMNLSRGGGPKSMIADLKKELDDILSAYPSVKLEIY